MSFEEELTTIITEREKILTEIERVLFTKRYKIAQKHIDIFSVQSISMVYAIWEGFAQQAFQLYISQINSLQISFDNFSDAIKIFHMENTFKQFNQYPTKNNSKLKFYSNLQEFYATEHHNLYLYVNTQSNLGFDELNKILEALCLKPFSKVWQTYAHPNPDLAKTLETFLRYRNSVAHGGDITSEEKVTQEIYNKYRRLVIDLMYGIYERMIDGLEIQSYLKSN